MNKDRMKLIISMVIFGTVGIVRKGIPLSSAAVAFARGSIGALFLLILHFARKRKFNKKAIKDNLSKLIISGVMLGINWIFLFESFRYTSVAVGTVCYYMAPVLMLLAAPFVFGEKLTLKKSLCALAAVIGVVLVSGVAENGISDISELRGVGFGLAAAVLYACIVMVNKKITEVSSGERSMIQLGISAISLLPYVLVTEKMPDGGIAPFAVILVMTAAVLHTGIAYDLYFGSIPKLPTHTVAIFGYIDPVTAVLASALILHEKLTVPAVIGTVLVIGGSIIGELDLKKLRQKNDNGEVI